MQKNQAFQNPYCSHTILIRPKLTNDIIRNLFNTLGPQVNNYDMANSNLPYARTKAFIYTIAILGMHDEGLDRIISEAFVSNATLDNWGTHA